jgi:hypothetical protein
VLLSWSQSLNELKLSAGAEAIIKFLLLLLILALALAPGHTQESHTLILIITGALSE